MLRLRGVLSCVTAKVSGYGEPGKGNMILFTLPAAQEMEIGYAQAS